jgi:hypothetical protein
MIAKIGTPGALRIEGIVSTTVILSWYWCGRYSLTAMAN